MGHNEEAEQRFPRQAQMTRRGAAIMKAAAGSPTATAVVTTTTATTTGATAPAERDGVLTAATRTGGRSLPTAESTDRGSGSSSSSSGSSSSPTITPPGAPNRPQLEAAQQRPSRKQPRGRTGASSPKASASAAAAHSCGGGGEGSQPQPHDISLDGLSVVALGFVAALVQICGGPGSPMGQCIIATEIAFSLWMLARYQRYNKAVLSAQIEGRRPEDVEALWRLFSHSRAGLLRHVAVEDFLQVVDLDLRWDVTSSRLVLERPSGIPGATTPTSATSATPSTSPSASLCGAAVRDSVLESPSSPQPPALIAQLPWCTWFRSADKIVSLKPSPGPGLLPAAGAPIRRGDVADFLAYAFWGRTRADVEALPGGAAALESKLGKLEEAAGFRFSPGRTPGRHIMAHVREPLRMSYRPAVMYGVMELLSIAKRLSLAKREPRSLTPREAQLPAGYRKWLHPLFAVYELARRTHGSQSGDHLDFAATMGACTEAAGSLGAASSAASKTMPSVVAAATPSPSASGTSMPNPAGAVAVGVCGTPDVAAVSSYKRDSGLCRTLVRALRTDLLLLSPKGSSDEGAAAAAATISKPPIVLLHGIGIGLLPYQELLDDLSYTCPDRPLLVLEYKHVSMRLTAHVPCVDEVAGGVSEVLRALGHSRATVIGHSYGTLVASRFSKLFPDQVHSLVLLDAVCFGMVMPQLLRGSIYHHLKQPNEGAAQICTTRRRKQDAAAAAGTLTETGTPRWLEPASDAAAAGVCTANEMDIMREGLGAWLAHGALLVDFAAASVRELRGRLRAAMDAAKPAMREWFRSQVKAMFFRDMHTAVALTARFRWADINMWPHELPVHSLVVLSGQDDLISASSQAAMLQGGGRGDRVMVHMQLSHGEMLKDAAWRGAVVRRIVALVLEADADTARLPLPLPLPFSSLANRLHPRRTVQPLLRHLVWSLPPLPAAAEQGLLWLLPEPLRFSSLAVPFTELMGADDAGAPRVPDSLRNLGSKGETCTAEVAAAVVAGSAGAGSLADAPPSSPPPPPPPRTRRRQSLTATPPTASKLFERFLMPSISHSKGAVDAGAPADSSGSAQHQRGRDDGGAVDSIKDDDVSNTPPVGATASSKVGVRGACPPSTAKRSPLLRNVLPYSSRRQSIIARAYGGGSRGGGEASSCPSAVVVAVLLKTTLTTAATAASRNTASPFGVAGAKSHVDVSTDAVHFSCMPTAAAAADHGMAAAAAVAAAGGAGTNYSTHNVRSVAVAVPLPETATRVLLLLPGIAARLLPVLPEVWQLTAPEAGAMWVAMRPLLPKLARALLPLMLRFLSTVVPTVPYLWQILSKGGPTSSAAASAAATCWATTTSYAAVARPAATAPTSHGSSTGCSSSRVDSGSSRWVLGVVGMWAAAVVLQPESSTPHLPSAASCCCCTGGGGGGGGGAAMSYGRSDGAAFIAAKPAARQCSWSPGPPHPSLPRCEIEETQQGRGKVSRAPKAAAPAAGNGASVAVATMARDRVPPPLPLPLPPGLGLNLFGKHVRVTGTGDRSPARWRGRIRGPQGGRLGPRGIRAKAGAGARARYLCVV